jgi:chemotaxis protein MotB
MKFKNRPSDDGGGDEWLTTYSDLVTLLLAFFVLLFSFSEIDAAKWQELVESFSGDIVLIDESSASSIMDNDLSIFDEDHPNYRGDGSTDMEDEGNADPEGENSAVVDENENTEENFDEETDETSGNVYDEKIINEQFDDLYNNLMFFNDNEGLKMEITRSESEIKIRLSNNMLFAPEKADINQASIESLQKIVEIIRGYDEIIEKMVMEGNTDNLPTRSSLYRDNFELSLERALNVLYFFKYQGNFNPQKLVPMGYGEYNPVASNDTVEGRSKNRRTDVILVKHLQEQ